MVRFGQLSLWVTTAASIGILYAPEGCGSNNDSGGVHADLDGSLADGLVVGDTGPGTFGTGPNTPVNACPGGGLQCYVPPGCTTSLSGTVYDPAGRNPLYNVVVFIPNNPAGTLPTITPGTHSCNTCDASIGDYVAATTSDDKGNFTLTGVPATTHVPLVVQTGKWRREVFLPNVKSCADNAVSADDSRLPRSQKEGDLPQMALLTGGCDDLGCFMKSMGLDDSEYTSPHGGGRLDIYRGVSANTGFGGFGAPQGVAATLSSGIPGNCTGPNCPLWASRQSFEYYDITILSCECAENNQTKPAAGMQALHDWLDEGGKVFASHFHYTWFKNSPDKDFQGVAKWLGSSTANGMGAYNIDTSFPKGQTLHDWLENVGALDRNGLIDLHSVATSVSTVNPPTLRWIYEQQNQDTKYLSFLTPIGGLPTPAPLDAGGLPDASTPMMEAGMADASTSTEHDAKADVELDAPFDAKADVESDAPTDAPADVVEEPPPSFASDSGPPMEMTGPKYCGKAVFTDLHTSASLYSQVSTIPSGCSGAPMTAQQKALEFLFFDLSACVSTDSTPPPPPPPPTR